MAVDKKAQASIFVLVGVVIIIAAGFLIYVNRLPGDEKLSPTFDTAPIKLFVEECIRDVGKESLVFVGKQGGYYDIPEPELSDDVFTLPYYYFENLDFVPTKEQIENAISTHLNENLLSCINDFTDLKNLGFGVEYGSPSTSTLIGEEDVSFNVNFPVKVTRGDEEANIEDHSVRIDNAPIKKINSSRNW